MDLNEILEIPQFKGIELEKEAGEITIIGELQNTDKSCPDCKKEAVKPHQYYKKRVRTLPLSNKPTYLSFIHTNYLCLSCGRTYLERIDFVDRQRQYTKAYEDYVYELARKQDWSRVAELEKLSFDIIQGIFLKEGQEGPSGRSKSRRSRMSQASHR